MSQNHKVGHRTDNTGKHKAGFNLFIDDGDIVFVNNHKILHARTAFTGGDRLLLRVRIDLNSLDASEA